MTGVLEGLLALSHGRKKHSLSGKCNRLVFASYGTILACMVYSRLWNQFAERVDHALRHG